MTTNTAGAVSEDQVLIALNLFHGKQFPELSWYKGTREKKMRAALEAALGVSGCEPSPLDASAPPRVFLQVDTDGDDNDRSEPIPEGCWLPADITPDPSGADETGSTTGLALYIEQPNDGGPNIRQGRYDHPIRTFIDSTTAMSIYPDLWSAPGDVTETFRAGELADTRAAAPAVVVDEATQKDAERYRKLRNTRVNPYAVLPCGESLDTHVDAIAAALKQGE